MSPKPASLRSLLIVLVVIVALAAGVFFGARRHGSGTMTSFGERAVTARSGAADVIGPVDLRIDRGRLKGPSLIKVKQDDTVVLRVTSDSADEFHLHGYDLLLPLYPGRPAELRFVASHSGRFTFELHREDLELGALEVYPR